MSNWMQPSMIIPRKLHLIWVGKPMPKHLRDNVLCWETLHPDWEVKVWGDKDLDWLENRPYFDLAERYVPADAVGQFRADLARYEILHRDGGFYADCDTYPLKPIDYALRGRREFAAREDDNFVGNTYLGSVARHEAFEDIIKSLPNSIDVHRGKRPCISTGPQFLTPIWYQYKCYTAPTSEWFPYSWSDVRNGNKLAVKGDPYACHTWEHSREMTKRKGRR
jgi:mannosyltransferase OCH1-like enzyme